MNRAIEIESKDALTFKVIAQFLKLYFGECHYILVIEVVYLKNVKKPFRSGEKKLNKIILARKHKCKLY